MENANLSHNKIVGEFEQLLAQLTKSQREKMISGYDIKSLAKIFEDGELMRTVDAFLINGMNVSGTSRKLYMHRNTLMYKLNAIKSKTGLNLHDFGDAVTFCILRALYRMK